jgi:hypothetical protein
MTQKSYRQTNRPPALHNAMFVHDPFSSGLSPVS